MSNPRTLMDVLAGAGVPKTYGPSERVPKSGIYDVIHLLPHKVSDHHQVTCVKGEPFPPCRDCKAVKYKLFLAAYHLKEHPHLLS
jgi:hypothetical protein